MKSRSEMKEAIVRWYRVRRLKLSIWAFPMRGWGTCANRQWMTFKGRRAEATLVIRYTDQPDGYSHEEMLRVIDAWLGRKATAEEIATLKQWKG